jgi:hypothetical protein
VAQPASVNATTAAQTGKLRRVKNMRCCLCGI